MYLHSPYTLQRKHLNVLIYFWTILLISDEKEVKVRKLLILSVNMLHRWNAQQISHLSDGTMVTIITTKTGTVWYFDNIYTFFFNSQSTLECYMYKGVQGPSSRFLLKVVLLLSVYLGFILMFSSQNVESYKKYRNHNSLLCKQGSCHVFVYLCIRYMYPV